MTPTRPGWGPQHLPGGLCAGLWRAERFSAAAFSRTVAMAVAAGTPPSQPAVPRIVRPRRDRLLTGTGRGGAQPGPAPAQGPARPATAATRYRPQVMCLAG